MTFELGVNYWPRRSAMYAWREFDAGEIREEMAQTASIGFDVVRIFALAQDFIPLALTVDATMAELAAEGGRARAIPKVLDLTADEYYREPAVHFARLYARWPSRGSQ